MGTKRQQQSSRAAAAKRAAGEGRDTPTSENGEETFVVNSGFGWKGVYFTRHNEHRIKDLPAEDIAEMEEAGLITRINSGERDPLSVGTVAGEATSQAVRDVAEEVITDPVDRALAEGDERPE